MLRHLDIGEFISLFFQLCAGNSGHSQGEASPSFLLSLWDSSSKDFSFLGRQPLCREEAPSD